MKWFYIINGETQGPFYLEEILANVKQDTLVWREDSIADWIEAGKHPLLQVIFNSAGQNSKEEVLPVQLMAYESSSVELKKPAPYEINLVLNTDGKTKGFGSRGFCFIFFDNEYIQKVSLDGFDIKIKTEIETPSIIFAGGVIVDMESSYDMGKGKDLLLYWLEALPNDVVEITIPNFDCTKNYKVYLEYGDRSKSFFFGNNMGIMHKPKQIEHY